MDWLMAIAIIITRYLVLEIHSPWPPTHRVCPICRNGLIPSDDPPLIHPLPFRKTPWMTDNLCSVHVAVPVHRRRTIASHKFVWRFHDDDEWTRILLQWVRCDNIITFELAVRVFLCTQFYYVYLAKRMHFWRDILDGTSGWTLIMLGLYLFANYHNFPSFCSPHRGHWLTANFATLRDRIAHP